jgi:hypothetical protein
VTAALWPAGNKTELLASRSPQSRIWSRRIPAVFFASVVAAGAITLTGATTASADPSTESDALKGTPTDALSSHDQALLADAEAKGEQSVTLIVSTDNGKAKDVAAELKKLGGSIGKQVASGRSRSRHAVPRRRSTTRSS